MTPESGGGEMIDSCNHDPNKTLCDACADENKIDVSACHGYPVACGDCGCIEVERLRAELADTEKSYVQTLEWLKESRAENSKLRALCAEAADAFREEHQQYDSESHDMVACADAECLCKRLKEAGRV
jgi:hypothetical protein